MSGTTPTGRISEEKALTCAEVCSIIEISSRCGVTTLSWRDLELSFHKPVEAQRNLVPTPLSQTADVEISEIMHAEMNREALLQDEVTVREEQMAQMFIEDPAQAEAFLKDEELEDDDGPEVDDD